MPSNLPIDVVPNTSPPRFRWRQTVNTPASWEPTVIEHEGLLPPSVENAIVTLIGIARQLELDNERLRRTARAAHQAKKSKEQ